MATYEFDSIGTHWAIELLDDAELDETLLATIYSTAEQFDQRYSRFRDDSLVMELDRAQHLSHPPVEMVRMLNFAREVHDISGGVFDITIGDDLHRMGYGKRVEARAGVSLQFWHDIVLTPVEIIIPDATVLDFGGFGKGWLIDQFVRDIKLASKREFIVNGGGDLYIQAAKPIDFSLEDPYDSTKSIGHIKIQRGALAGSNTIKRTGKDGSQQKHHIIDPRPHDSSASGVVASFVAADSALIADTMATILIIDPSLEQTLANRYHLKTMLIRDSEKTP